MTRRWRLLSGLVLAAVGVVGVVAPSPFTSLPATGSLVTVVGAGAAFAGAVRVTRRRSRARQTIRLGDPGNDTVETPGRRFDRALRRRSPRVRDRLAETVRETLERVGDVDATEVAERLQSGEWTDDALAASFFAGRAAADGGVVDLRESFRSDRRRLDRQVERVLSELERLSGRSPPEADSDVDPASDVVLTSETLSDDSGIATKTLSPPAVGDVVTCRTGRWIGVDGLALIALGIGVLARSPGLLLVGAVGAALATVARAATAPVPSLELVRDIDEPSPDPGEEVTVTLRLRNAGRRPLVGFRFVDGVPADLQVVGGSPSVGGILRGGDQVSASYTVRVTAGRHEFEAGYVRTSDSLGATERAERVSTDDVTTLTCLPPLDTLESVPLRAQTSGPVGRVATDTGGEGVEFYTTREYRSGDPLSRIDWRQFARRGELTTVQYREERSATVVVVVDARAQAAVSAGDGESALARGRTAAGQVFATLLSNGNRAGLAAVGDSLDWFPTGAGRAHRERGRQFLCTASSLQSPAADAPNVYRRLRTLRTRLPGDAQVFALSPLVDDAMADALTRLDLAGNRVTVVSPDPTDGSSPGRRLERIERDGRLSRLRSAGIPVGDWSHDEPLEAVFERMRGRYR